MGTLDSTSTWYIFIMPEFTCTHSRSLPHALLAICNPGAKISPRNTPVSHYIITYQQDCHV